MAQTTTAQKAEILSQALPYIQKYNGKTVVVKYGGNAMTNNELKEAVMGDIVLLSCIGIKVVLVHGGGPEITGLLKKIGKESKFINGLRYTDEETRDVAQMVLAGKLNKDLVAQINAQGGRAMGLCGVDGGMLTVKKMEDEVDYGFVGEMTNVDPKPITDLLDAGYIPVITSIGADENGVTYNINADTMACYVASALKAENIILMTDVRGLLMDKNDENTLIPTVAPSEVPDLIEKGIIAGGMIPKIQCCVDTLNEGVTKAAIIDGRIVHAILIEMLSDEGIGTMIYKEESK
ncbi:MAG: acetylglutamate kinase [Oscillospiraceae bacterium]|jgi:acetylglutamate kinase|nr:acetylglutamate kinase [Oscillospiraceae bacterium]